jgi:hypothetical protein
MAKLLILTQVYENYGAHDWDGEGECPQYWKAKGGSEYVVKNIDVNRVDDLVKGVWNQVESASEYYRETILSWEVVEDDYLTEYEQSQLEYEGRIMFPAKELTI